MTTAAAKKARPMPKGGKKGGSMFPRIALAEAIGYAKKLVSKTHTGPQTSDIILMGVMGSKYDKGLIGMSALKQYGFLAGDKESGFSADELARKIVAAPSEEYIPLYRKAALKPKVFKALFDTYHGDTVTRSRLKQRAADLNVHPDETGNCVELYVACMVTAGLVTVEGDQITHLASVDAEVAQTDRVEEGGDDLPLEVATTDQAAGQSDGDSSGTEVTPTGASGSAGTARRSVGEQNDGVSGVAPRAVFNVNVTLDASLDVEKLEKQLALLRKYGAL